MLRTRYFIRDPNQYLMAILQPKLSIFFEFSVNICDIRFEFSVNISIFALVPLIGRHEGGARRSSHPQADAAEARFAKKDKLRLGLYYVEQ